MRIAVLVSGSGTLLDSMLTDGLPIDLVISDRSCAALDVAARHGVSTELVERTDFSRNFDRDGYTDSLVAALRAADIDLVVMAGFGTVAPKLAGAFPDRLVNTHPALLPAFKGWHAVRDALVAGVKVTGCTVHLADEEMDEGTILAQEAVPVLPGDTEETLHERIKVVERRLLVDTVRRMIEGELP